MIVLRTLFHDELLEMGKKRKSNPSSVPKAGAWCTVIAPPAENSWQL